MNNKNYDIESLFFHDEDNFPELDKELQENTGDNNFKTITPLKDVDDVNNNSDEHSHSNTFKISENINLTKVPTQASTAIDTTGNLSFEDAKRLCHLYNRILTEILSYYKSLFPDRFNKTLSNIKYELDESLNKHNSLELYDYYVNRISIYEELINRYHYEAFNQLTIKSQGIIKEIVNSEKRKIEDYKKARDEFIIVEADDFINL